MIYFKTKPMLSLLLALTMIVTMLPLPAQASEGQGEQIGFICTDEACSYEHQHEHEHEQFEIIYTDEAYSHEHGHGCGHEHKHEPEPEAEEPASDNALDSPDVLVSPDEIQPETEQEINDGPEAEQPQESEPLLDIALSWTLEENGTLRITGYIEPVYFLGEQPWKDVREKITAVHFETDVEFPDLYHWFYGCVNLTNAAIPVNVRQIGPSDFADCAALSSLTYGGVDVLAEIMADYGQGGISLFTSAHCGVTRCTCTGSCSYTYRDYRVAPESNNYHIMTVYCANCSRTDGIIVSGSHSFSGNTCSLCGYTKACSHSTTYTSWSDCNWYRYCQSCGALVSSGTSHGTYIYGSWEYYNATNHRRNYYCSDCGSGSYSYESHSTTTRYSQYSSTQHSVGSYCSTCNTTISTSYASHSFSYGSWQSYSDTQHRRLKTCSQCGYNEYEYSNHTISYGSWQSHSETQHRRLKTCSQCAYSVYEYSNHALSYGNWTIYSDTQHRRTASCPVCSYSIYQYGSHADTDSNGACDACGYEMTRFSVTVPANLSLTVSKYGEVYTAGNAAIINNSTGAVKLTHLTVHTVNGWTLVPYSTNMAAEKVNSKRIGFSLNEARSSNIGATEALVLTGAQAIASGSAFPLSYNAVISATTTPISEQVLTVVFVLEWAA